MKDPVVIIGACDGRSYERASIVARFRSGDYSDPITSLPMDRKRCRVVTNTTLREMIESARNRGLVPLID